MTTNLIFYFVGNGNGPPIRPPYPGNNNGGPPPHGNGSNSNFIPHPPREQPVSLMDAPTPNIRGGGPNRGGFRGGRGGGFGRGGGDVGFNGGPGGPGPRHRWNGPPNQVCL